MRSDQKLEEWHLQERPLNWAVMRRREPDWEAGMVGGGRRLCLSLAMASPVNPIWTNRSVRGWAGAMSPAFPSYFFFSSIPEISVTTFVLMNCFHSPAPAWHCWGNPRARSASWLPQYWPACCGTQLTNHSLGEQSASRKHDTFTSLGQGRWKTTMEAMK